MMYKCRWFVIQELIPPHVYEERGNKAWELLDERALRTLDLLRAQFGSCTVNNWHSGGKRRWSGLRTPESPYYSPYSQHTFGRAFDCVFSKASAEEVRAFILKNKPMFPDIYALELDVNWLHFDCRNSHRIKVFKP